MREPWCGTSKAGWNQHTAKALQFFVSVQTGHTRLVSSQTSGIQVNHFPAKVCGRCIQPPLHIAHQPGCRQPCVRIIDHAGDAQSGACDCVVIATGVVQRVPGNIRAFQVASPGLAVEPCLCHRSSPRHPSCLLPSFPIRGRSALVGTESRWSYINAAGRIVQRTSGIWIEIQTTHQAQIQYLSQFGKFAFHTC